VRILSLLMRIREKFSVCHSFQDYSRLNTLNPEVFRDRLPKKRTHLIGMSILSFLLSLGPGYHNNIIKNQCLTFVNNTIKNMCLTFKDNESGLFVIFASVDSLIEHEKNAHIPNPT